MMVKVIKSLFSKMYEHGFIAILNQFLARIAEDDKNKLFGCKEYCIYYIDSKTKIYQELKSRGHGQGHKISILKNEENSDSFS